MIPGLFWACISVCTCMTCSVPSCRWLCLNALISPSHSTIFFGPNMIFVCHQLQFVAPGVCGSIIICLVDFVNKAWPFPIQILRQKGTNFLCPCFRFLPEFRTDIHNDWQAWSAMLRLSGEFQELETDEVRTSSNTKDLPSHRQDGLLLVAVRLACFPEFKEFVFSSPHIFLLGERELGTSWLPFCQSSTQFWLHLDFD